MTYNTMLDHVIEHATTASEEELIGYYNFLCEHLLKLRDDLANKRYRSLKGCKHAVEYCISSKHVVLGVIASRGLINRVVSSNSCDF